MLDLSPTKLLIIFVVAVVLLGPKRLPQFARQLGAAWRRVRELHRQIDQEMRKSIPDLPSSRDIVHFARSPVTLLNQLAEMGSGHTDTLVEDPGAPPQPDGSAATVDGDGAAGQGGAITNGSAATVSGAGRGEGGEGGDRGEDVHHGGPWPESVGSDVPAGSGDGTAAASWRSASGVGPAGLASNDPSMN